MPIEVVSVGVQPLELIALLLLSFNWTVIVVMLMPSAVISVAAEVICELAAEAIANLIVLLISEQVPLVTILLKKVVPELEAGSRSWESSPERSTNIELSEEDCH